MRNNAMTVTVATLVLGVFAAFFRWLQNANAFEAESGLPIPGHATSVIFAVYCIAAAALIVAAAAVYFRRCGCASDAAALRSDSAVPTVLSWIFCAVFVLGAVLVMFSAYRMRRPAVVRLLGAFGILGGLCFPFLTGKKAESGALGRMASGFAALLFCYWMVCAYLLHSEDPVTWNYCVEILALAASTAAFYHAAAFHFGAGKGNRALAAVQLAVFFDLATLFDARSGAFLAMIAASAAMLLLIEYLLIANMTEPETK